MLQLDLSKKEKIYLLNFIKMAKKFKKNCNDFDNKFGDDLLD
jgi:hypothetical protein